MNANLYIIALSLHSYLRWLVLLTAVMAIGVSFRGLLRNEAFKPYGRKAGALFVGVMDLQFLLGFYLYATSPIVRVAWANMHAAMKQKELRVFAVEHITSMVIAVVLAHIGSFRARRGTSDRDCYNRALLWYSASFIVMLIGIPWWRPLLRSWMGG